MSHTSDSPAVRSGARAEPAPALFLDRDGTIIRDAGFLSDPAGVELLPGAAEALRRAAATHRLYLHSNQSGVGRGYYTWEQAVAVNDRALALLGLPPPGFAAVCLATETPDEPAVYRKPSPRFILECVARDGLDPARCWMIGDRLSDLEAGVNAGVRVALVRNPDYDREALRDFVARHAVPAFGSLAEAVDAILAGRA